MAEEIKVITSNRKAHFEYFLSDFIEAGIELVGTEIKSIRFHGCSLNDSYILIRNDEAYIIGMNIAPFFNGNIFNHEPLRTRKLLLHKKEIRKLIGQTKESGITLIPLNLFIEKGWAKLELGVAKAKKLHDKRESLMKKTTNREIERAIKNRI